ncbi:hypothetical protein AQUCO_00100428v1 [Aquilegia coerulea]|uniref:Secreted protein n=1 Tax=Aquilegia coerulea TaxID=218851 RepID=A0A2G5FAC6_AQUCA|nr:hypothetical protein AQUCO_00100428v1 [Aquilegia coerulea]
MHWGIPDLLLMFLCIWLDREVLSLFIKCFITQQNKHLHIQTKYLKTSQFEKANTYFHERMHISVENTQITGIDTKLYLSTISQRGP